MTGLSDLLVLGALVISIGAMVPTPCHLKMSLDITNGVYLDDGSLLSGNVSYPRGTYFEYKGTIRGCICKIKICIRKCCALGEAMFNLKCQEDNTKFQLDIYNWTEPMQNIPDHHFYYLLNIECGENGVYRLAPNIYPQEEFYIQADGNLYKPGTPEEEILHPEDYCVERFHDDEMSNNISALVCFCEQHKLEAAYSLDHKPRN